MMPLCGRTGTIRASFTLVATLSLAAGSRSTSAQGPTPEPPRVVANELVTTFAEALEFRLEVASASPIQTAILRYQVGEGEAVQRRRGELLASAGSPTAALEFRETLSRGQIPPASEIRWWWTLDHDDGTSFVTAPEAIVYLDEHFEWRALDTEPLRVWTYGPLDGLEQEVANEVSVALESAADLIGSIPDRKIEVVTFRTRSDMLPALVARGDAYEERLATLGARVAPDIILLLAQPGYRDINQILAHEISHVVLHLAFEESYIDAPLWLDEGLAMVAEGELEGDDQRVLERAIRDDEVMSLRSLTSFPGRAELVPLAYAQSHDIVSFLIDEKGPDAFGGFLDDVGSGDMTVDEALNVHYGGDQLYVYQEYRASRGLDEAQPPEPGEAASSSRRSGSTRPCLGALLLPAIAILPRAMRRLAPV